MTMSSSHSSGVSFETATLEFQNAWNDPSHTQFELPPVNVNKVLKDSIVLSQINVSLGR